MNLPYSNPLLENDNESSYTGDFYILADDIVEVDPNPVDLNTPLKNDNQSFPSLNRGNSKRRHSVLAVEKSFKPRLAPTKLKVSKPVQAFVPLDVWRIIFDYVDGPTIWKLRNVCTRFKELLSPQNPVVYKTCRINSHGDIREGPPCGLTEFQYVDLLTRSGCHGCQKKGTTRVFWAFQRRYCSTCIRSNMITCATDWDYPESTWLAAVLFTLPRVNSITRCNSAANATPGTSIDWREALLNNRRSHLYHLNDNFDVFYKRKDVMAALKTVAELHGLTLRSPDGGNTLSPVCTQTWINGFLEWVTPRLTHTNKLLKEAKEVEKHQGLLRQARKTRNRQTNAWATLCQNSRDRKRDHEYETLLKEIHDVERSLGLLRKETFFRPQEFQHKLSTIYVEELAKVVIDEVLKHVLSKDVISGPVDFLHMIFRCVRQKYNAIPMTSRPRAYESAILLVSQDGDDGSHVLSMADVLAVADLAWLQIQSRVSCKFLYLAFEFNCPACVGEESRKGRQLRAHFIHLLRHHGAKSFNDYSEFYLKSLEFGLGHDEKEFDFPWHAIPWYPNLPILAPHHEAFDRWDQYACPQYIPEPSRTNDGAGQALFVGRITRGFPSQEYKPKIRSSLGIVIALKALEKVVLGADFKMMLGWFFFLDKFSLEKFSKHCNLQTFHGFDQSEKEVISLQNSFSDPIIMNALRLARDLRCKICAETPQLGNYTDKTSFIQRHWGLQRGSWITELLGHFRKSHMNIPSSDPLFWEYQRHNMNKQPPSGSDDPRHIDTEICKENFIKGKYKGELNYNQYKWTTDLLSLPTNGQLAFQLAQPNMEEAVKVFDFLFPMEEEAALDATWPQWLEEILGQLS